MTRLTPVSTSDTIYFGSLAVPASNLFAGLLGPAKPAPSPVAPPPIPTPAQPSRVAPSELQFEPVSTPPIARAIQENVWLLAALAQAPLLALLIVALCRGRSDAVIDGDWASLSKAAAATTFALALAAVWLGCSFAVAAVAAASWPLHRRGEPPASFVRSLGSRLAILVSGCGFGCAAVVGHRLLGC